MKHQLKPYIHDTGAFIVCSFNLSICIMMMMIMMIIIIIIIIIIILIIITFTSSITRSPWRSCTC